VYESTHFQDRVGIPLDRTWKSHTISPGGVKFIEEIGDPGDQPHAPLVYEKTYCQDRVGETLGWCWTLDEDGLGITHNFTRRGEVLGGNGVRLGQGTGG